MSNIFQEIEDYKQKHKDVSEALALFEKALHSLYGENEKVAKKMVTVRKVVKPHVPKSRQKSESGTTTTGAS